MTSLTGISPGAPIVILTGAGISNRALRHFGTPMDLVKSTGWGRGNTKAFRPTR